MEIVGTGLFKSGLVKRPLSSFVQNVPTRHKIGITITLLVTVCQVKWILIYLSTIILKVPVLYDILGRYSMYV